MTTWTDDENGGTVWSEDEAAGTALGAANGASLVGFTQSGSDPASRDLQSKVREVERSLNDHTTAANAVSAAMTAGQAVAAPFGTTSLTGWAQATVSSDLALIGKHDAVLDASDSETLLKTGGGDIVLKSIDLTDWTQIIDGDQGATPITPKLIVDEVDVSSGFSGIFHESPLTQGIITFNSFDTMLGTPIKIGYNSYANQDLWTDVRIIGNRAKSLTPASAIDTYLAQTNGKRHIFALNSADTITGNGAGETWFRYGKDRWSLTLGNVVTGISTGGSGNPAAYQMKGAGRGDTANGVQGYSDIFASNIAYGSGGATERGVEVHVEDGVTVGNLLENFGKYCLLLGDPTAGEVRGLHVANKLIGAGVANNYGVHDSTTNDDIVLGLNAIRTVERGINLAGTGRNRHVVGNNITDASAIAMQQSGTVDLLSYVGNQVDGATRALYVGGTVTRFLAVANNWDALTDNADLSFQIDGGVKSGVMMANAPIEINTTGSGAVTAFRLAIPTNTRVSIKLTVIAVKDDNVEDGTWFIQGTFYNNAGTATERGATTSLMAAKTSTWGGTVPTIAFSPTGSTVRFQVTPGAVVNVRWSILPEVQWLTYA